MPDLDAFFAQFSDVAPPVPLAQFFDVAPGPQSRGSVGRRSRGRRSPAEIEALEDAIIDIAASDAPVTVRQVFYRLVGGRLIAKTEQEYRNVAKRLVLRLRRDGRLPYEHIADSTRWQRKPATWGDLGHLLQDMHELYRRDLWRDLDVHVEVWLEKEALAGAIYPVTARWQVPLMVTRGYPSETFLFEAGQAIAHKGKPAFLYHLGDHDPSGRDIDRHIEEKLQEFAPEVEILFDRIAVTETQIESWRLPTRPTKRTDSRAGRFEGESVEVDAIPPDDLRELVEDEIKYHIPEGHLEALDEVEEAERATLAQIAKGWA